MKNKLLRSLVIIAAVLVGSAVRGSAVEPPQEDAALAPKLIAAIERSDYAAFIADGEAPFQQLTEATFAGVASKLAPRLHAGHDLTYLGDYKQHGYRVSLWKITFRDGSDDLLATLSVKDGKVGGFFYQVIALTPPA